MPCCGTSGVDRELAAAWIGCLSSAMGFGEHLVWTEKLHARIYQLAAEMRSTLEGRYPDLSPLYDRGWGVDAGRTAQLASVLVLEHPQIAEAFWSCAGITQEQAIEQMRSKSGSYWDVLMSALGAIYNAETTPLHSKNDGPLAGVLLIAGSVGAMLGFAR